MSEQLGKNPFNFYVDEVIRHPYEQKLLTNDDEFRADIPDTKKMLLSENKDNIPPAASRKTNNLQSTNEKENIYPSSSPLPSDKYIYAPTMVSVKQFDKKFKLPKVKKVKKKTPLEKFNEREKMSYIQLPDRLKKMLGSYS